MQQSLKEGKGVWEPRRRTLGARKWMLSSSVSA